jgi:predicted PurR-regulated permease PerM
VVAAAARAYRRGCTYIWGRLGVAVVSGLLSFLLCHLVAVPGAVVLGVVVGLGSLVPMVGLFVAGLPIALLAAGLHGTGASVLVVLAVMQVVETVVVQRRLGRRVLVVGPAPTLLGSLVGFELGGLSIALLAAVAVVAVAAVLTEVTLE